LVSLTARLVVAEDYGKVLLPTGKDLFHSLCQRFIGLKSAKIR
jgi:hypothetical protein